MCGRYALHQPHELKARFKLPQKDIDARREYLRERYNIRPSQLLPAIVKRGARRHLELMLWGFVPRWAKNPKVVIKYRTFNARSEEVFDRLTWKDAIRYNRCLVPATGFYEWLETPTGKLPFFIHPKDQELFAFAGVYGSWHDSKGKEWQTYSILTTAPNKDVADIHDRMPVILQPADEDRWLDPANDTPESIADLLRPYDDGQLEVYRVSPSVNTARVDKDRLIRPIKAS